MSAGITAGWLATWIACARYPVDECRARGGRWAPTPAHPARFVFPDGSALVSELGAEPRWRALAPGEARAA